MERIALQTIDTLTPSADDDADFVIPSCFTSWTIHVLTIDDGATAHDDSYVTLMPWVASDWREEHDSGGLVQVEANKAKQFTRSYHVGRVRVRLTNGAIPPSGGAKVELWGSRES